MRFCPYTFMPVWRRSSPFVFLAFWGFTGLLSGAFAAFRISHSFSPLMRMAASCPVSIVGLLASNLLPLLFSVCAVYFDIRRFLYPVAFFKLFLFSFVSMGVIQAYQSAAWLVHFLFLFSDSLSLPVLCLFWTRQICGRKETLLRDTLLCLVFFVFIGGLDFYLISPFLANL